MTSTEFIDAMTFVSINLNYYPHLDEKKEKDMVTNDFHRDKRIRLPNEEAIELPADAVGIDWPAVPVPLPVCPTVPPVWFCVLNSLIVPAVPWRWVSVVCSPLGAFSVDIFFSSKKQFENFVSSFLVFFKFLYVEKKNFYSITFLSFSLYSMTTSDSSRIFHVFLTSNKRKKIFNEFQFNSTTTSRKKTLSSMIYEKFSVLKCLFSNISQSAGANIWSVSRKWQKMFFRLMSPYRSLEASIIFLVGYDICRGQSKKLCDLIWGTDVTLTLSFLLFLYTCQRVSYVSKSVDHRSRINESRICNLSRSVRYYLSFIDQSFSHRQTFV